MNIAALKVPNNVEVSKRDMEKISREKNEGRRVFNSLLEFFVLYWDDNKIPNPMCVFVGDITSPLPIIADMFPSFTFHVMEEFG